MKQHQDSVNIFVPKGIKKGDNRVAIPPHLLNTLLPAAWYNGQDSTEVKVLVESQAGIASGYNDASFETAGAEIVTLEDGLNRGHILVDVKQRESPSSIIQNGINLFYAHVEKGQGLDQLTLALE